MKRILAGAIVASALLACSEDPARRPAEAPVERPTEIAQADSALISLDDTTVTEVTPTEEPPPPPKPAPRARASRPPAPEREPAPQPPPEPAPEPTATVEEETTRIESTVPPVASDSVPEAEEPKATPVPTTPDTVGTARPIPPASPSPVLPSMEATNTSAPADAVTLPAGTELHAALVDSIHSRHDSVGRRLTATIMENVPGPDGSTLIPAGSLVRLIVVRLQPATSKSAADGSLELKVDRIRRGDDVLQVAAEVRPVPHELRGRGVTGSEAAKVGVGAAAGAIAGRVLGGDTRGAVIGGVVGAAGGAAVASQTADRDVVVKAGTPISFVLTAPLVAGRL